jgi:hypothetical protein
MAVELAKLSLWLTTVASNKPLSFLDHHLRCGNSLIGAELEKLTVLPGARAEGAAAALGIRPQEPHRQPAEEVQPHGRPAWMTI